MHAALHDWLAQRWARGLPPRAQTTMSRTPDRRRSTPARCRGLPTPPGASPLAEVACRERSATARSPGRHVLGARPECAIRGIADVDPAQAGTVPCEAKSDPYPPGPDGTHATDFMGLPPSRGRRVGVPVTRSRNADAQDCRSPCDSTLRPRRGVASARCSFRLLQHSRSMGSSPSAAAASHG
jgi:hypothetical protein